MVKAEVGFVVCWGKMILLPLERTDTPTGEKWLCLVLVTERGWELSYPQGGFGYFRDIDFTERLA